MTEIKIYSENGGIMPHYANEFASGMDCFVRDRELWELRGSKKVTYYLGFRLEIPVGFEGQIRPKSSIKNKNCFITNSPGTIDCDYRGEVMVVMCYNSEEDLYDIGEACCQLVIAPVESAIRVFVTSEDALSKTSRGAGGYGSTNGLQVTQKNLNDNSSLINKLSAYFVSVTPVNANGDLFIHIGKTNISCRQKNGLYTTDFFSTFMDEPGLLRNILLEILKIVKQGNGEL